MTAPPPPSTVEMFDPRSGESIGAVSPQQARDLYLSGQASFREDQQVHVQTPDGIVPLTGAQAAAYLQTPDAIVGGLASPDAYARQEEQKHFDTLGHEAAAVGLGLLYHGLGTGRMGRGPNPTPSSRAASAKRSMTRYRPHPRPLDRFGQSASR